jgi:hypothetical protein
VRDTSRVGRGSGVEEKVRAHLGRRVACRSARLYDGVINAVASTCVLSFTGVFFCTRAFVAIVLYPACMDMYIQLLRDRHLAIGFRGLGNRACYAWFDAGWMLAGCWLDAGLMLAGCWLDAGWMLAGCWLDAGWMLGGCRSGLKTLAILSLMRICRCSLKSGQNARVEHI